MSRDPLLDEPTLDPVSNDAPTQIRPTPPKGPPPGPLSTDPYRGTHLGAVLGEGGMGIVYEAEQPALARTLAIKRLKDPEGRPEHVQALLCEARLTGLVAHPNVVPVHDLRLGDDGTPELLLKRIQGTPWSRLLRSPDAVKRLHGRDDPLSFHIEVLEQVCGALQGAHARGVLHRDLKPANVMVGRLGEVYLLDWGLAVTTDPKADPRIPQADAVKRGAGTPQYMAPEMVSDRFGPLGPWTDVYLLGGLLFQILNGRPPHHGANVWNLLVEACKHGVEVPDEGPEELVRLTRQCLERRTSHRLQDAASVQRALRTWMDHRPSVSLAKIGLTQERNLIAALAHHGGEDDASGLHEHFGAATFAYRRALDAWPQNQEARSGLRRTVERLVAFELTHDRPHSAQAALAHLGEAEPELTARVQQAVERSEAQRARSSRWLRQRQGLLPTALGRVTRRRLALAAAAGLMLHVAVALASLGVAGLGTEWLLSADLFGIALLIGAWGLSLGAPATYWERQLAAVLITCMTAQAMGTAAAVRLGLGLDQAVVLELAVTLVIAGMAAIAVGPGFRAIAAVLATTLAAAVLAPWAGPYLLLPAYGAMAAGLLLLDDVVEGGTASATATSRAKA